MLVLEQLQFKRQKKGRRKWYFPDSLFEFRRNGLLWLEAAWLLTFFILL